MYKFIMNFCLDRPTALFQAFWTKLIAWRVRISEEFFNIGGSNSTVVHMYGFYSSVSYFILVRIKLNNENKSAKVKYDNVKCFLHTQSR